MYDVVVIGAGPAGYEVASLLGSAGKNVCIIEKEENSVGGTCLNEGCIPAKNFLETATYAKKSKYFADCGLDISINSFDMQKLKDNTCRLICDTKTGVFSKLSKGKVEIKYGTAKFDSNNTIKVNDEIISANEFVLASGSIHREHPLLKVDGNRIISSKEVFTLNEIPKSILVVGAGAIGCEFATFFNSLGCEVEIAEFTPKIVPIEDDDVSKALKRELERQGIKIHVKANVTSCEEVEDGLNVTIDLGKKVLEKTYEKILVSIGRAPNTKDVDLKTANIEQDRDFIEVDSNYKSVSNSNVYAIGDIIKTPALAHVAYYEAKRVSQIILKQEVLAQKAIFPSVTFCSPQVASIGSSEKELKEEEKAYKIKKLFFKTNVKAKIKGDDSGFIKIIHEEDTGLILGASIVGNDATELIHQFLIAINANMTLDDLSKMIFAHPTLSEAVLDLVAH
ncbi:MAG: dihydrolipoyl dehydrogenase [Arcobacter sp.]|nr:dihydrolipoyl dehydrogenase [Arcobacter sp.]